MLKNYELKGLFEKRNAKLEEMDKLTNGAVTEERALTDEEKGRFEELEGEVRALSDTIEKCRKSYEAEIEAAPEEEKRAAKRDEAEIRAFENYVRQIDIDEELRADSNFTLSANGAVIPETIANKIIETVKDRCRIFELATKYNMGGDLVFPVYDESTGAITMSYAEEFNTLTATSGKFTSVTLTGFLSAALTKVSKSLINNSQFALFPYVVGKMSEAIALWLENELLKGTSGKIAGLSSVTASVTTLTADSLIELQDSVKNAFQSKCRWIMNPATKSRIRKLKDGQGNYLLEKDYKTGDGTWTLLGKPVEITDAMVDNDIFYGDFSGLYVKIAENPSIEVLKEVFATEHCVGLVAWLEMDAKVIEPQKIKRLTVAEG